jgi:hypothetical protein
VSPIMLCIFHFLRFLLFYFYFLQFSLFYFLSICFLSFFPFYLFSFCGCVTICHFNYLLRHQDASLTCIFVFLAGKYPKRNTHTHTHTRESSHVYEYTVCNRTISYNPFSTLSLMMSPQSSCSCHSLSGPL